MSCTPGGGRERARRGSSDFQTIRLVTQRIIGTGKHLQGTRNVQELRLRKCEHQDVGRRGHGEHLQP